jgi:hypothetical protein
MISDTVEWYSAKREEKKIANLNSSSTSLASLTRQPDIESFFFKVFHAIVAIKFRTVLWKCIERRR